MNTGTPSKRSPVAFFALVFALSVPFWVFDIIHPANIPIDNLPVTDIGATFVPAMAAMILLFRTDRLEGIKQLLARTFDLGRIREKIWYVPVFLLMPVIYALAYWIMRLIGLPVPAEWHIPVRTLLVFIAFFFAAAGEELGYMGYVIDPMQERLGALATCLIAGCIHAVWHYPSMIQIGQTPGLMAWGTLMTVGFRIISVWLYNNTGKSVGAVILFHAVTNTGRNVFPGGRPAVELADAAVCYGLVAIAAAVIVLIWGPKTLTRPKYA
jgi:membrane protease YdiL (CAAX protease family)